MIGLKSTLITGAAGLILSLGLAFLWKNEQAKNARLEGELSQAIANTETLKTAVESQKATIEQITTLVLKNQERLDALAKERDAAQAETAAARTEIDSLRAAEGTRALAAPFERGNVAHERFDRSLRRIAGAQSGTGGGGDGSDTAQASNAQ